MLNVTHIAVLKHCYEEQERLLQWKSYVESPKAKYSLKPSLSQPKLTHLEPCCKLLQHYTEFLQLLNGARGHNHNWKSTH